MTAVTPRLEDYLEALFLLETSGSRQTVTALAENLKLTKGTIATVVKKMAEQELVWHESYGSIRLTEKGRKIGWQVYMKHERLTSFFHDFLGQDADRSEEIACLIEHHLDGAAASRFFNLIDFLRRAQTEKREWTEEMFLSLENTVHLPMPLSLAVSEKSGGRVCRLTGASDLKARLQQEEIVTGAVLEKISCRKEKTEYTFLLNGKQIVLNAAAAATVWII